MFLKIRELPPPPSCITPYYSDPKESWFMAMTPEAWGDFRDRMRAFGNKVLEIANHAVGKEHNPVIDLTEIEDPIEVNSGEPITACYLDHDVIETGGK
jgi:hypothetical protein